MTVLKKLADARVFGIYYEDDGGFQLMEMYDGWYEISLTRDELLQLADEIRRLANGEHIDGTSPDL